MQPTEEKKRSWRAINRENVKQSKKFHSCSETVKPATPKKFFRSIFFSPCNTLLFSLSSLFLSCAPKDYWHKEKNLKKSPQEHSTAIKWGFVTWQYYWPLMSIIKSFFFFYFLSWHHVEEIVIVMGGGRG